MGFGKKAKARRSFFQNRQTGFQIRQSMPLHPGLRKSLIRRLWEKSTESGHYPTDN